MLYIILLIMIIIIVFIVFFYFVNRNTNIVEGEIIRIEKKMSNKHFHRSSLYDTIIIYSYIVNNKKYIGRMRDIFEMSNLFYQYIKINKNEKLFAYKKTYHVKNKKIKVRYKINNPQDSLIYGFYLKTTLCFLSIAIVASLFLGLIFCCVFFYIN